MVVEVVVKRGLLGKKFKIDLCVTEEKFKDITVLDLKRRIAERKGVAESEQIILFHGENLEDDRRLSDYGVKHKSILRMRRRQRGGASSDQESQRVPESEEIILFDGENLEDDKRLSDHGFKYRRAYHRSYVEPEAGGMGDKKGKNRSMENLLSF